MRSTTLVQHTRRLFWLIAVTVLCITQPLADDQAKSESGSACYATGEPCFLGIDPDIYQMPLFGEYIQNGSERICATRNWSPYPPEAFDINFLRNFWATALTPGEQAQAEGLSFALVMTHWGPPFAPAADLAEVVTPSAFPGEVFGNLESRTTRIEFEVPKTDFEKIGWTPTYLPIVVPPDPQPEVPLRLRGWYIKGDGLTMNKDDRPEQQELPTPHGYGVQHPLMIMSTGFPYSIAFDSLVGAIDVGTQVRKTITYFVAQGFDVLIFDKRGHGFSEGIVDGMGEDIFRVLDQLEKGTIVEDGVTLTLTIIRPDGTRLKGIAAAEEGLLGPGYTAKTKPIVLRGFSYGSNLLQRAMALNYSDYPIEYSFRTDPSGEVVIDDARMPMGNRGYNFRGMIAISGFVGSLKYETAPFFMVMDANGSTIGHNGGVMKSGVFMSMNRWPGFLGLHGTNDFETADGAIDAYNSQLRGEKDIKMVTGYHFGLPSKEVDTYFAYESEKFARNVLFGTTPLVNTRTTSLAREVCDGEDVDMSPANQSITRVNSHAVKKANEKVDRFIERWIASL
jgi:pimeloyl-ACP methyl ester carboxylesterase